MMANLRRPQSEDGFTLVELLLTMIVLGVISAVAFMGINGLSGDSADASCQATIDAVRQAVAVHFQNQSPHAFPTSFTEMQSADELRIPGAITNTDGPPATLSAHGWTISLAPDGTVSATGATNCK